eukprot:1160302-Pelagomonas_calceolata.AAC.2
MENPVRPANFTRVAWNPAAYTAPEQLLLPSFLLFASFFAGLPPPFPPVPMTLLSVARQLNSSSAEALVACVLTEDAHLFIDTIHEMKKPLKSMVFTNGPAQESSIGAS